MITKDRALEVLANLDAIAFPALSEPSLYFKELESYILGDGSISVGQECGDDSLAKLVEKEFGASSLHKRVTEEGTLLHYVKDLKWPEGAICVVQDMGGTTKWLPSMPRKGGWEGSSNTSPDKYGNWWFLPENKWGSCSGMNAVHHLTIVPLASDWRTAIITKEMWEAVQ